MTIHFAPYNPAFCPAPLHQPYLRGGAQPEADPTGKSPNQPGAKLDAGKTRAWLMVAGFAQALDAVAQVTTVGATKYTPDGWKAVPDGQERYMDAFMRHTLALASGETHDADTGCLHKAQACWNLLAALELELMEARSE